MRGPIDDAQFIRAWVAEYSACPRTDQLAQPDNRMAHMPRKKMNSQNVGLVYHFMFASPNYAQGTSPVHSKNERCSSCPDTYGT